MSKITLITGGVRSGKSKFAENMYSKVDDVLYIATSIPYDEEMILRIEKHKERRNKNWNTLEKYKDIHLSIANFSEKYLLLDCVTVMITNLIFLNYKDEEELDNSKYNELLSFVKNEFELLIENIKKYDKDIIFVTNEVGMGLVPEYPLGRAFRDIQGIINSYIASNCDEVYFVCCGIPLKIKGD